MIRTFVAVPIPEPLILAAGDYQEYLKQLEAPVRWVRPENLHITLKFLGDVDSSRLQGVIFAIRAALASETSFSAALGGSGVFPNSRSPRVIWMGVDQGASRLSRLVNRVETAVAGLGFERETRPFRPHITLGRVKSNKGLSPLLSNLEMNPFDGGKMSVDEVHLMKSTLTPEGAIYEQIEVFNLRG